MKNKKETLSDENTISDAIKRLEKKYGDGVLIEMDNHTDFKVETISTGIFSLDNVLGRGLPKGRIIELFGQESSGKSTLSQFLIAQVQKKGGRAALIDVENAFDGEYAANIGVDVSKLLVSQAESLESAFDVLKELVETNLIDIIVIDSVAALVPKSEIEGEEMLKDSMAVQARLLGKALRILSGPISRSKTIVIFINQLREKIGVFFGKKEVTPGGKALKFFSSVRLEVSKGKKIEGPNEVQIGNEIIVTAVKNKVGFPWKSTKLDLYYARGIDTIADTIDFGVKIGVIKITGMTYAFGDITLGVGREKAIKCITDDQNLCADIQITIDKKNNTNAS
jgi:recombination protein RecA